MSHQHPRHLVFSGADGNRLEADGYGHGPRTAMLLHGGGQTRHAWRATCRRLAQQGFTAVAVDQRGHGDSAWIDNGDYAFSSFGRDAAAVARQIAERFGAKPVGIGASMGGIASLYAECTEHVLSALVLVDITPRMDPQGVAHIEGFMKQDGGNGFASIEEAAEAVSRYLTNRPRPPSIEGLRKNLRQRADGRYVWHWDPRFFDGPKPVHSGGQTYIDQLEAMARTLTVPTLLVRGSASNLILPEHVERFMSLVPHTRFADVSGAGHMVAGDRNDVFANAILEFLEVV